MNTTAGLKPCPFCGGDATICTYEDESLWSRNIVTKTQVGCEECGYSFHSEEGFELEAPAHWNTRTPEASDTFKMVVEAAQAVIDRAGTTFKARNGRDVGIEGEDGEKCWIVHSDDIEALRAALAKAGAA